MSPKVLDQVLARIPRVANDSVLVGFDTSDDAGVYKLTPECALVQTVDFFTPIVDDPYTYGAIAAANSLSDVYAMGGVPLTALSILAYPVNGDLDDLAAILAGGAEKMSEARCAVIGGHSINDDEVKFGYSVTGTVHPARILTNAGAREGDALLFTKLIGTGVIATALKRGIAREEDVAASLASMLTLNQSACHAMTRFEVHACTDISGFGLIGHAREVAAASRVTLKIEADKVRFLPGAVEYARAGAIAGGLKNNREFAGCSVHLHRQLPEEIENLLYDPQTSGGLLVALPEAQAAAFEAAVNSAYQIGTVTRRQEKPILIV
ncbi:MAG: selenide, water dikinase SelD [Bryobacteraceae bacterium]